MFGRIANQRILRTYQVVCFVVTALVLLVPSAFAWPTVYPTGTTLYEPDKAENCYILFTPLIIETEDAPSTIYLINMDGNVVHQWGVPFPALYAQLLPNGNVVVIGNHPDNSPGRPGVNALQMGGSAGWLVELTWDGKKVFEHANVNMHHAFAKLPSGNYLYLAWEQVPGVLQARVRGGIKGSEFPGGTMFNDYIVEVNKQGQAVWTWHANEHLDPDVDIIGPLYKRREWCHGNSIAALKDGNILLTSRSLDAMMIIDKKSGKIIYRWGNNAYLDKSTGQLEYRSDMSVMGGPHDAREIPDGYPGAGHLTCYDNRTNTGEFLFSRVVEVDRKTGQMDLAGRADKARAAGLVVKTPLLTLGRKHFSDFLGGAQRLRNGNTLVCDGGGGRFFQMTGDNKVVWEYVNPYKPAEMMQGSVFRIYGYTPDYCPQFKGLPPAAGSAVQIAGNAGRSTPGLENVLLLVLGGGSMAAISFALGWRLSRRKTN